MISLETIIKFWIAYSAICSLIAGSISLSSLLIFLLTELTRPEMSSSSSWIDGVGCSCSLPGSLPVFLASFTVAEAVGGNGQLSWTVELRECGMDSWVEGFVEVQTGGGFSWFGRCWPLLEAVFLQSQSMWAFFTKYLLANFFFYI